MQIENDLSLQNFHTEAPLAFLEALSKQISATEVEFLKYNPDLMLKKLRLIPLELSIIAYLHLLWLPDSHHRDQYNFT